MHIILETVSLLYGLVYQMWSVADACSRFAQVPRRVFIKRWENSKPGIPCYKDTQTYINTYAFNIAKRFPFVCHVHLIATN